MFKSDTLGCFIETREKENEMKLVTASDTPLDVLSYQLH